MLRAVAVACLALALSGLRLSAHTFSDEENATAYRLIVSHDQQALFVPAWVVAEDKNLDGDTIVKMIEETVDAHADAKVDVLVQCVFARFSTGMPNCQSAQTWRPTEELFPRPATDFVWNALEKLDGRDRIRIALNQCRKRDIKFVAGLRMNDRHRITKCVQRMYDQHPEWRLEDVVGALSERVGALDFKYDGVRERLLVFISEFLGAYDVDGMEFDYMRMCHMFRPNEAKQHAHFLTDLMRKSRAALDSTARDRKRGRLLLGIRVPASLQECRDLGFDIKTWGDEGLVDYITPSDFWSTDFATRTEEFTRLTAGTSCQVYPSVSPTASYPSGDSYLKPAHYRAAAKNFYAFGADGVSAYNYFWTWAATHNGRQAGLGNMWPTGSLLHLTQLKQIETITASERSYLCYPLWSGRCPTGAIKNDRIVINRKHPNQESRSRFRMAENLAQSKLATTLEFKTTGLHKDDTLAITLNGRAIANDQIERRFDSDGQTSREGLPLPAFFLYSIKLRPNQTVFGDTRLGARLTNSNGSTDVAIQEIEVTVAPMQ